MEWLLYGTFSRLPIWNLQLRMTLLQLAYVDDVITASQRVRFPPPHVVFFVRPLETGLPVSCSLPNLALTEVTVFTCNSCKGTDHVVARLEVGSSPLKSVCPCKACK